MNTGEQGSACPAQSAEISYDLVMEDLMSFVEGAYRLPGGGWQVFVFSRRTVAEPVWRFCTWANGAGGIVVRCPPAMVLNTTSVEQTLAGALGITRWSRVNGPDSMSLR